MPLQFYLTQPYQSQDRSSFEAEVLLPEGEPADLKICQSPGEALPLRALSVAGTPLHRIQFCAQGAKDSSLKRMVLAIHKAPTPEPADFPSLVEYALRGVPMARKIPLVMPMAGIQSAEMNCHGYSLLATLGPRKLGLPPGATWIEGMRSMMSEGTVALPWILKQHFDLIDSAQGQNLQISAKARKGDLIAFANEENYIHSGVLVPGPGSHSLWVQSKLDQRDVVTLPLENLSRLYNFERVEIYRRSLSAP